MRRSASSVAVVLVAVLAIGGCGRSEGDQPVVVPPVTSEPTSSGAPSAAGTPSSASSPRGSATGKPGDAELIAVAVRYYEAVNRASRTLDSTELTAITLPSCQGCQAQLAFLRQAASNRYDIEGGELRVLKRRAFEDRTPTTASLEVEVSSTRMIVHDRRGNVVHEAPPQRVTQQVDLVRDSSPWQVAETLITKRWR